MNDTTSAFPSAGDAASSSAALAGLPLLTSPLLSTFASHLEHVTTSRIHASYLPIPPLMLIHAIRMAHLTKQLQGGSKVKRSLTQELVLNQTLLWSACFVSSALLAIPNPLLLSSWVVFVYCTVHAFWSKSGLGELFLHLSEDATLGLGLELLIFIIDALTRPDGIIYLGINSVLTHPDSTISTSPLAALLLSIIMGGGTLLLIDLFDLTNPAGKWALRTPTFASSNPSMLLHVDLWSSALLGYAYLALTRPEGFSILIGEPLAKLRTSILPAPLANAAMRLIAALGQTSAKALQLSTNPAHLLAGKLSLDSSSQATSPLLSEREARIVLCILLFSFFVADRFAKPLLLAQAQATRRKSVAVVGRPTRKAASANSAPASSKVIKKKSSSALRSAKGQKSQ